MNYEIHQVDAGEEFKICPQCGYKADADYNAARNLATLDIEKLISQQCKEQDVA